MKISNYPAEYDIKIGTIVVGNNANCIEYMKEIIPYGFESFTIMFWQGLGGVDLKKLADQVNELLDGTGIVISTLGMFGNPLETGEKDIETLKGWQECIDHAHLFGCDIVGGFSGRLRGLSIHKSLPRFKEVWSKLAAQAENNNVKIAFENCDMQGTWQLGDWNIAHNPVAWNMMFNEVPSENLGLEWEPCHQLLSLIDPIPQLKEWVSKIFHVHGKDATVHWDVIRKYGIHSCVTADMAADSDMQFAPRFAEDRTPGFGDSNWSDIITELRRGGFTGSIDIEGWHDPVYKDDLEMTGQVHALNYLKNCRGGNFVPNP